MCCYKNAKLERVPEKKESSNGSGSSIPLPPACLSSFLSPFISFFPFVCFLIGRREDQRTTFRNQFCPSTMPGIELKLPVAATSVFPCAEPSLLPEEWSFCLLNSRAPTSNFRVLESSLKRHRLLPSDFQGHLLPLYCGGSGADATLLPSPIRAKPQSCPLPNQHSTN